MQVKWAVAQLVGYMSVYQARFGILTSLSSLLFVKSVQVGPLSAGV